MSYVTYEKYKTGVHRAINTHLRYKSDANWKNGIFQRKEVLKYKELPSYPFKAYLTRDLFWFSNSWFLGGARGIIKSEERPGVESQSEWS